MKIEIQDLFYLYDSDGENVVALRGMYLNVQSGECLVVKGPNGSGKSTLVRLLSGFIRPSAGKIFLDDKDITAIDPLNLRRKFVSSIDQKGNLISDLSVLENLALAFRLSGHGQIESRSRAKNLLATHNLAHLFESHPSDMSAGERQLCALLTAVAGDPKILVADEPSGELDNASAEKIYEIIRSIAGRTTILLVTHDVRAEKYADRIVRIRDGRISAQWLPGGSEDQVIDPLGWKQVVISEPVRNIRPESIPPENELHGTPFIRVNNLELTIGPRKIFTNVTFEAREGDFIGITGSSGTGKSSLLRIVCGIQDPTSGTVHVQERIISELSRDLRTRLREEQISYLGQGDSPITHITLDEYCDVDSNPLFAKFSTRRNRRLSSFSGGERARIEIFAALSQRRKILILDEPTSQLDEKRSYEVAELLVKHVESGGIVIASTRDEVLLSCPNKIVSLDLT